ncbi:MAG: OmpA family protein [Alphaproteobacteria bacterium]|nr:MAG: OmpA family protein [Alphaproteobacteria bacterium]
MTGCSVIRVSPVSGTTSTRPWPSTSITVTSPRKIRPSDLLRTSVAPPILARKVFLVFFDWDRDTITPEGRAIIGQAADAWRAGGNVTIQVTGYTDASGSAGYNQRLSERRANNVASALAQAGVPRQAMVVSGRGKNDQRVPTADGVREPQNRRVEIVFP